VAVPGGGADSNSLEWQDIVERTSDSTVSRKEMAEQATVLDLRSKGYSVKRILNYTGIGRARYREWMLFNSAFREEMEERRHEWLDHEVEQLIPMAKKTMSGREVKRSKLTGKKLYDRAEQESVRLLADVTMKIAGREYAQKWAPSTSDVAQTVLLQINIPPKDSKAEFSDPQSGQAAEKAARAFKQGK